MMAPHLEEGFAKAGGGKSLESYDILPFVRVALGDDLDQCRRPIKEQLALYIGGMGARNKNFYNDYAKRLGYEEAAVKIQDAFLGGQRAKAVAAVPDELVDEVSLVGPKERIVERLAAWKAAAAERQVDTLLAGGASKAALRVLAEAVL
jgi:alkanesulfonate monooxygenase SsuD/methylene tetrahydromethanopterin reductase-like flavin-dependent oxidoreductase (luciferase family)